MRVKFKLSLIIILLISVEIIINLMPALAQISPRIQLANDPPVPPTTTKPINGRGSGTRSEFCEHTKFDLKPLLPLIDGNYSGLTLKEHPTFWFYVPYKTESISSGKFVLQDNEENAIYELSFKLPKSPGFISISIPNTAKPLEKNKPYKWKLRLDCASKTSDTPFDFTQGWIQRVELANLETQLRTAKPEERVKLYIENKIWYDAASDFANNQKNQEAWFKLLKAVGLEQLKQEPICGSVVPVER